MSEHKQKKRMVEETANRIIAALEGTLGTPAGKANLAHLRNSIGRPLSRTVALWPLIYSYMPDYFLDDRGFTTYEERAILTTLGLYALHQQGNNESVNERNKRTIGRALKALRVEEDTQAVDRRFNALVTSETFEELSHYLRQMIGLLRSKTEAKVDYAKLAEDLYWFQRGYRERMRLSWARDYYRIDVKKEKEGAEDHE
ncbi:MAG: type I-E CRISPR-associated protein Cse2/CasB [Peptoniphilus sp.]|nr:type I-E CRISPR-associated protein Cse2/CasB [Peptoniphilus sp.]MDD7363427.1 type I-E CRISPR-associated protein Cse2/CasB [Bacillota bacterium]MDY6044429.1 type I-E CRISPR-associated protein Cse2/CasB [Peptoniphilus sp.]